MNRSSEPEVVDKGYEKINLVRDGRLLIITLHDPAHLNAFGPVMHEELTAVLVFAATDPDSDVILITGSGKAFSAGGDIARMAEVASRPALFDKEVVNAKRLVYALLEIEKPVVAKVNGHAVGLGATLALLCDVVFASTAAKIGDPHVSVGLVAGDGGCVIWPQLVGFARAKEYLLTGDLIPAPKAAEIGLINHAVPPQQLDDVVQAFCSRLLRGATQAIRWTKVTVNLELKRIAHAVLEPGLAYEALSVRTSDHREALQAFLEKRPPNFNKNASDAATSNEKGGQS